MKHISGMIRSIASATFSAVLLLAPGAGWAENGQSSERHETVNERQNKESGKRSEIEIHMAHIRTRLSQAWYPPASTTKNMSARAQITLLPTGELDSVRLVGSSGNQDFDDSMLDAVRSLNRYPVPDDRDTFERYFRQFTIEFTPQRLR